MTDYTMPKPVRDLVAGFSPRRGEPLLRSRLAVLSAGTGAAFLALTAWVMMRPNLPFDLPIELAVQRISWGPLMPVINAYAALGGIRQVLAVIVVLAIMFFVNRKAMPLLIFGIGSSAIYYAMNFMLHRPRPSADLVHVAFHEAKFSYPSGHAVIFTTMGILIALTLRQHLPRWGYYSAWVVAIALVIFSGLSRIWMGLHWPSDVIAGELLGVSWTSFGLALRPLSDPILTSSEGQPRRQRPRKRNS